MSEPGKTLARNPSVIAEVVEDELVLLLPQAGTVLVLNEVGRTIWEQLDGHHGLAELADLICAEYEVERERALADTAAFLDDLLARGLVVG